jgi:hypothetical protein
VAATTISSHGSEPATLSGGLQLGATWTDVLDVELQGVFSKARRAGVTVKKAKLQRAGGGPVPDFTELYADSAAGAAVGRRLVRARYPNSSPETEGIHTRSGWLPSKASGAFPPGLLRSINSTAAAPLAWGEPKIPPNGSIYDYAYTAHARSPTTECGHARCQFNATTGDFPKFGQFKIGLSGRDGPCAQFTPPAGIWCQSHPDAGRTFEVGAAARCRNNHLIPPRYPSSAWSDVNMRASGANLCDVQREQLRSQPQPAGVGGADIAGGPARLPGVRYTKPDAGSLDLISPLCCYANWTAFPPS